MSGKLNSKSEMYGGLGETTHNTLSENRNEKTERMCPATPSRLTYTLLLCHINNWDS